MEEHKDSFVRMTIVTLITLAAVMMILYACSKFFLQKLRRSMSSKKAVGLPYYQNPIVRYRHRIDEMDDPAVELNEERKNGRLDPRATRQNRTEY